MDLLTIVSIVMAVQDDWKVKCTDECSEGRYGQIMPEINLVKVYLETVDSKYQFDMTLLHEFTHIHDLYTGSYDAYIFKPELRTWYERDTENRAQYSYNNRKDVLKFLFEMYSELEEYYV